MEIISNKAWRKLILEYSFNKNHSKIVFVLKSAHGARESAYASICVHRVVFPFIIIICLKTLWRLIFSIIKLCRFTIFKQLHLVHR